MKANESKIPFICFLLFLNRAFQRVTADSNKRMTRVSGCVRIVSSGFVSPSSWGGRLGEACVRDLERWLLVTWRRSATAAGAVLPAKDKGSVRSTLSSSELSNGRPRRTRPRICIAISARSRIRRGLCRRRPPRPRQAGPLGNEPRSQPRPCPLGRWPRASEKMKPDGTARLARRIGRRPVDEINGISFGKGGRLSGSAGEARPASIESDDVSRLNSCAALKPRTQPRREFFPSQTNQIQAKGPWTTCVSGCVRARPSPSEI